MDEQMFNKLCNDVKAELDELVIDVIFRRFQERLYIDKGDCHFEYEILLDNAEDEVAKWIATILVSQMKGEFQ